MSDVKLVATELPIDEIDDGILGAVITLHDAGIKTFSSCQGGGYGWGHGYQRPTICFDGDEKEGERAERIATEAGYQVFQVNRSWYTRDNRREGPFWEMEFVAGAACRADKDRERVAELRAEVVRLQRARIGDSEIIGRYLSEIAVHIKKFDDHTRVVGEFLSDMYATMVDPLNSHEMNVKELCEILLKRAQEDREALLKKSELEGELEILKTLLNTPEIEDFDKAVPLEAAHQVKRWGVEHDSGKLPSDWFWLVGYLAGKALNSHVSGNIEKAKHHCISTAAALRNWHAHIRSGETAMRPGIKPPEGEGSD